MTTTGTYEYLSVLHDATLAEEHKDIHDKVHDVVMSVTSLFGHEAHHEVLDRWKPGWGKREADRLNKGG